MTPGEIALGIALFTNFGGLVWGASRISTSVDRLERTVTKLENVVEVLDDRVDNHNVRIAVLEDKREAS